MNDGPLFAYRRKVAQGELMPDPAQALAAEKLQGLHHALASYRPLRDERGWLARFGLSRKDRPVLEWYAGDAGAISPKQGLYMFGDVGRGKSMLMDLFYDGAPIAKKRRLHFHDFMQESHRAIHRWRNSPASKGQSDPIPALADHIAKHAWLLCFDEMQVSDIADAMILGRLFQALLDRGVVVVATSNRAPDDLYKDGLQRDRFLPFIALIKEQMDLLELASPKDHRLGREASDIIYHTPLGEDAEKALARVFAQLSGGLPCREDVIDLQGRSLSLSKTAGSAAWATFEDLCGKPLGAADYLALSERYRSLLLSNIPILSADNKDKAKRFVTLIDILYERKTFFACSAAAEPDFLYPKGEGSFEFQRTVSRLMEMRSASYIDSRLG